MVLYNSDLIENIEITDCAFSDHKILKIDIKIENTEVNRNKKDSKMIRNLTKLNINNFNDKFENINFEFLMSNDSTNFNVCAFKNTILQTLDETVPYKAVNSSRFSKFPWLNQELVDIKKLRDHYFVSYKHNFNIEYYYLYKNIISIKIIDLYIKKLSAKL